MNCPVVEGKDRSGSFGRSGSGEIADPAHAAGGEIQSTEFNAAPVFPAARVNYG
jgi:hypothetical protein